MATDNPLSKQVGGDHYKDMKIQPVEFIHANQIPYIEGAVIKYVCRWRNKNGVEDLKKAQHYLDLLIELEEKQPKPPAYIKFTPSPGGKIPTLDELRKESEDDLDRLRKKLTQEQRDLNYCDWCGAFLPSNPHKPMCPRLEPLCQEQT